MKLLLLTPLAIERDCLKDFFAEQGWRATEQQHGKLTVLSYDKQGVILALSGHGKTQSGIQTQYLLSHIGDVGAVICAGAAGSLTESVRAGDLVVAEKTVEHDYTLKFVKRPLPEFPGSSVWLERARALKPVNVHFGAIASGDEDIIDKSRAEELYKKTGALAVAWEGAGCARACAFNGVPFLEIRAVTDAADSNAEADFRRQLRQSMKNLAQFVGTLSL